MSYTFGVFLDGRSGPFLEEVDRIRRLALRRYANDRPQAVPIAGKFMERQRHLEAAVEAKIESEFGGDRLHRTGQFRSRFAVVEDRRIGRKEIDRRSRRPAGQ